MAQKIHWVHGDKDAALENVHETVQALRAGLADLESSLRGHIHLENTILHRQALTS